MFRKGFIGAFIIGFSFVILSPQMAKAGDVADVANDIADAIGDPLSNVISDIVQDVADGWEDWFLAPFVPFGDPIISCVFELVGLCDNQNQNQGPNGGGGGGGGGSCDSCGSCGDSRYRWCTGGSYGSGQCIEFTCDCRPDLCDGGGGGGGGGGPPPPPPPASVDLRVNGVDSLGSPVEFPNSFTLSWTTANADSCSADGSWSGGKSTSGSEEFSDIPRGTYSYTLNCSGPGGSGSDSVSIQVVQVPRCSLSANPTQIVRPQQSVLSWSCQYADSCFIDNGVGSVNPVSGTTNVSPIQSTLYSLTCSGLDGSRSFSTLVSVFVSGLKEVLPR